MSATAATAAAPNKRAKFDPAFSAPANKKAKKEAPPKILGSLSTIPRQRLEDFARAILQGGNYSQEDVKILEDSYEQTSALEKVPNDIWVDKVFPFLGPGHFLYVALVCRKFKQNYRSFFSKLEDPPKVLLCAHNSNGEKRPATFKDTFYRNAFSSGPCAEFWNEETKKAKNRLHYSLVCWINAKHGNLETLIWAHGKGFPWDKSTCTVAAENGHLAVLEYAHKNGCQWDQSICSTAAQNGRLECLKYAHKKGCPWYLDTTLGAARNGHLECLKYAHENGCDWDNIFTCAVAAKYGHLDCLKYAHEEGCWWNERTCICAAGNGHLECLKYAHENGCRWNWKTCAVAATYGHLDCLKYAHEKGCLWDEKTCTWAAENGHFDCLIYAHGKGCPFNEQRVRQEARKNNHAGILKWLNGLNQGNA